MTAISREHSNQLWIITIEACIFFCAPMHVGLLFVWHPVTAERFFQSSSLEILVSRCKVWHYKSKCRGAQAVIWKSDYRSGSAARVLACDTAARSNYDATYIEERCLEVLAR